MSQYTPNSNDLKMLFSHNKTTYMRLTLLDETYIEVDTLEGKVVHAAYNKTNGSDIRRTATLRLAVNKAEYADYDFNSTWNKRMVNIEVGVKCAGMDTLWYSLGRMLIASIVTTLDATTMEVKLSLVDLMATLTESRGSQIGTDVRIPVSDADISESSIDASLSDIGNAIVATISTFGTYIRCREMPEFEDTIPYDINISAGSYPIDIINALMKIFPYYEKFYDDEGYFVVQKIPTRIDEEPVMDESIIDKALISEERSVDYSMVKNTTEIWGRSLSAKYVSSNTTSSGAEYKIEISDALETVELLDTFGFVPTTDSVIGQTLNVQDLKTCPIYTMLGTGEYVEISAGAMAAGKYYVVRYNGEDRFVLMGEGNIHVIVQEIDATPTTAAQQLFKENNSCNDVKWVVNTNSPFACTELTSHHIGRETRQVLMGGEYESIYTTQLAIERAGYENWKKTRLQDTVTLDMLLMPWIDVNDKIQYTSPASEEVIPLLVQSVDFDFEKWTMTVEASHFYPYYPFTEIRRNLAVGTNVPISSDATTNNNVYTPQIPISEYGENLIKDNVGDMFTVSFDWETSEVVEAADATPRLYALLNSTAIASGSEVSVVIDPTGLSSGHYSKSFIPTDAQLAYSNSFRIRVRLVNGQNGVVLTVKNFKLEKGSQETDWIVAPEG